jgi:hypothetical protein
MTASDPGPSARPLVEWENEGGALAPVLGLDAVAAPSDSWRSLAVLGAVTALWRDLPPGVRDRIACDAMVVMQTIAALRDPDR